LTPLESSLFTSSTLPFLTATCKAEAAEADDGETQGRATQKNKVHAIKKLFKGLPMEKGVFI